MTNKPIFSIQAKTCTLLFNDQKNGNTILGDKAEYMIPIYQRPYSWTEEQIRQFHADIFTSYWGNDGEIVEEPMFIGTMQLSYKNELNQQDIIDGQQRLTTVFLLLKVLKHRYPDCKMLQDISLNWLRTKVNNGKQQEYLDEVIGSDLIQNQKTLNPYLRNTYLICEAIDEQIETDREEQVDFQIDHFVAYLLSKIYFVVIETQAGLFKTLQIFNAINTTGLDLNGGDIFKLKMYEYLKKKGQDDTVFERISQLYERIDAENERLKFQATNINLILGIYQFILIARHNLPVTLNSLATDTFFERLFDTMLGNYQWEHFRNNVGTVELSIEDIGRIIDVYYQWENTDYLTAEDACAMHFIWCSRYSRFWVLTFVVLYKYKEDADHWAKMLLFMRRVSKLYMIYSIRFLRAINDVNTFTYSIIKDLLNKPFEDVIHTVDQKIGKLENHKGHGDFELALMGDITYNAKIKNIVCRLSAMLEEDYLTKDRGKIDLLAEALFKSSIDIEHIQSYHDSNGEKRQEILDEWGGNINSIGNLMVLEQNINRSISNNPYGFKISKYPDSYFTIVKNHPVNYSEWTLEKCLERKEKEKKKILNYIFNQ